MAILLALVKVRELHLEFRTGSNIRKVPEITMVIVGLCVFLWTSELVRQSMTMVMLSQTN